ncbi:MAG TPA: hypothetical protein VMV94_05825 [Phycisphaerae bacterium]|nr:hypothetical protein [Phycisphaerae bacterium]
MPEALLQSHTAGDPAQAPDRLSVPLFIAPALVALTAALWHGPSLIDDAYITFRYADNLAAGYGIVFNRGEAVLGTTTPLLTILLALFKLAGMSVPLAARGLGIVSVMGVVMLIQALALRPLGRWEAAALALCVALHPDLAFVANSGMETALSMAAVYGTMLLTLRGRYVSAGLVGGAAFLLRPDGALVILLAAGAALLHGPRRAWRPLLAAAVVTLPWLIYADLTYGGVVPHSVVAKQMVHADSPLHILALNGYRLTFSAEMKVACGLAVVGLAVALKRKSELLLVALWIVLYLAGLSAARISLYFPWYLSPLFPGILLLAAFGLDRIVKFATASAGPSSAARLAVAQGGAPVFLLALGALGLCGAGTWNRTIYENLFGQRTRAYLEIADILRPRCAPGDTFLVGEVGALAYALPKQVILDSSGINSPAVLRARQADLDRLRTTGKRYDIPGGSPAWVFDVIERFKPRFIVTFKIWMHIDTLMGDPRIMSAYQRLAIPGLDDYFVLERRTAAGGEGGGPKQVVPAAAGYFEMARDCGWDVGAFSSSSASTARWSERRTSST